MTFMLDQDVTYYFWAQKDGIEAVQGEVAHRLGPIQRAQLVELLSAVIG